MPNQGLQRMASVRGSPGFTLIRESTMSTNIREIYTQVMSTLSPFERLQLATLILNSLVQQNVTVVDDSDTWTEQDQLDLAAFSLQYATTAFLEDEEMAE